MGLHYGTKMVLVFSDIPFVQTSVHLFVLCLLNIHPFVCICFWTVTWRILPNVVCVLIFWRAGLGLQMGNFRKFYDRCICLPQDSGRVLMFHSFVCLFM